MPFFLPDSATGNGLKCVLLSPRACASACIGIHAQPVLPEPFEGESTKSKDIAPSYPPFCYHAKEC